MFRLVLSALALAAGLAAAQPASGDRRATEPSDDTQPAVSTPNQLQPTGSAASPHASMPAESDEVIAPIGFGWG